MTEKSKKEVGQVFTSSKDGEEFVALKDGFYEGARVRRTQTFTVTNKGEKFNWAKPATTADVTSDKGGAPGLLDKKMTDIVSGLAGLTDTELQGTLAAEQAGKARKGVITAIEDEIANRVGRVGGNTPGVKQPEEKEPKVPASGGDPLE